MYQVQQGCLKVAKFPCNESQGYNTHRYSNARNHFSLLLALEPLIHKTLIEWPAPAGTSVGKPSFHTCASAQHDRREAPATDLLVN
jgi:hypothetical protein